MDAGVERPPGTAGGRPAIRISGLVKDYGRVRAVAGIVARPGLVLASGLGLALVGYLVAALLPLSDALEAWAWLSPWDWALGGDPLSNPTGAARFVALAAAAGALILVGGIAFARRDVRSA